VVLSLVRRPGPPPAPDESIQSHGVGGLGTSTSEYAPPPASLGASIFCGMSRATQRVVGVLALLVAAVLSLPVVAYFLDGQGTENWIIPVQLAVMAAIGAGVTSALPALVRPGSSPARRALTGAGWGLLAAVVGVLVFWLLISGLSGA